MKRLTLLCGLDPTGGYGQTVIAFARGLEAAGVRIAIRASSVSERFGAVVPAEIKERIVRGPQSGEWELLIHPPNFVPTPGKKTAYFSMNESTRLTQMQVYLLNKAEVVIVPSEFCAVTFSASGVTAPIRVVRLGFDPAVFHWRPMPTGKLVFGTAGSSAGGVTRKGLQDVLECFCKAFPAGRFPNVQLRIKCSPDAPLMEFTGDDRVDITSRFLSDAELADWYASLNCFVSASKGEGFGLMLLEAMACGRPLLSPKFGGVSEYLNEETGYIIPHTLVPAPPPYAGHWSAVKESDLITQMQLFHVFQKTHGDGKRERIVVADLTWKNACEKLVAVLEEFGALADVPEEFHAL